MFLPTEFKLKYVGYLFLLSFTLSTVWLLIAGIRFKDGACVAVTCAVLGVIFSIWLSMLTHDDVKKTTEFFTLFMRMAFIIVSGMALYVGLSLTLWTCHVPVNIATFKSPELTQQAYCFLALACVFALFCYRFYKSQLP